jgi:hypothetical protein
MHVFVIEQYTPESIPMFETMVFQLKSDAVRFFESELGEFEIFDKVSLLEKVERFSSYDLVEMGGVEYQLKKKYVYQPLPTQS